MRVNYFILCFFSFFSFCSLVTANAQSLKFYRLKYQLKTGDTFASILKNLVKDDSIISAKTPMVKKTIAQNPNISNWSELPTDEIVFIYVSSDLIDIEKAKMFTREEGKKEIRGQENKNQEDFVKAYGAGNKISLFYMASLGKFNETLVDDVAAISYTQNSPLSMGLSYVQKFTQTPWMFNSSAYFSYLTSPSIDERYGLDNKKVSIPLEIGATLYAHRQTSGMFSFYTGLDLEKFSLLNLQALKKNTETTLKTYQITAYYGTLGAQAVTSVGVFKLSFSKTFLTSYEGPTTTNYNGYKYMFSYIYPIANKPYSLIALIKNHSLGGVSNLGIQRFGLGISYTF